MKVEKTTDYDLFSYLPGNRALSNSHVNRLMISMKLLPRLFASRPILVNENFQIIDGQHRFEAAKTLGFPIYYMIGSKLGVSDAQAMNGLQRNWSPMDFAYSNKNNPHYKKYIEIRESFPWMGHRTTMVLLVGSGTNTQGSNGKKFRSGDFEVLVDADQISINLTWLEQLSEAMPIWESQLVQAFLNIFKSEHYDQVRMLDKLKNYGSSLDAFRAGGQLRDNMRDIEDMFNFKVHADNRVRLF